MTLPSNIHTAATPCGTPPQSGSALNLASHALTLHRECVRAGFLARLVVEQRKSGQFIFFSCRPAVAKATAVSTHVAATVATASAGVTTTAAAEPHLKPKRRQNEKRREKNQNVEKENQSSSSNRNSSRSGHNCRDNCSNNISPNVCSSHGATTTAEQAVATHAAAIPAVARATATAALQELSTSDVVVTPVAAVAKKKSTTTATPPLTRAAKKRKVTSPIQQTDGVNDIANEDSDDDNPCTSDASSNKDQSETDDDHRSVRTGSVRSDPLITRIISHECLQETHLSCFDKCMYCYHRFTWHKKK